MNKIIRLSIANIRKHKKESILLGILALFCTTLMASSVSSIVGIGKITPNMVEKSECYKNFVQIGQADYKDNFLSFFEEYPGIEKYDHACVLSGILKIKNYADTGEDRQYDISFVSKSKEELLEKYEVETSLSEIELSGIEHPIYLDVSKRGALNVSEGDDLTIIFEGKELTFTVAGFYESGIWMMGTKAVISEEDYAYLEEYLDRYEVIGINTVEGTDNSVLLKEFEAFAKELSVNDIIASLTMFSYEDIVTGNTTNMSLLSIIVSIMAGVIVIAVIVMIRFRIVTDINEQLVSIGVLEAIGYTSGEIAFSYIVEYVLIAMAGVVAGITAMTRALSVRKYPPVLAFRKGIKTHHFKRTFFPLEKTKRNVHIRLALKGFVQDARQNVGLTICIAVSTVMVLISFMLGSFFSDSDRILGSVCGHELSDIRIQTVGGTDCETFAAELGAMPEVDKVLLTADSVAVTFPESENNALLEVYKDYSDTTNIIYCSVLHVHTERVEE